MLDDASNHCLYDSILPYLSRQIGDSVVKSAVIEEKCKSAQQAVFIVYFEALNDIVSRVGEHSTANDDDVNQHIPTHWREVLDNGRNRIVIRIWLGSSRWWNLNHPTNNNDNDDNNDVNGNTGKYQGTYLSFLNEIALHEVWGYQLSRDIFLHCHQQQQQCDDTNAIYVPKILDFSFKNHSSYNCNHNTKEAINPIVNSKKTHDPVAAHQDDFPWAIMEYVGSKSKRFDLNGLEYYNDWIKCMIRERDEFGFKCEPHPRWGRIPVTDCIPYAETVLTNVILPIHKYFLNHYDQLDSTQFTVLDQKLLCPKVTNYMDMVRCYREKYERYICQSAASTIPKNLSLQSHNEIKNQDRMGFNITINSTSNEVQLSLCSTIRKLGMAISRLEEETHRHGRMLLCTTPVLCHMDLQPQNLLFGKQNINNNTSDASASQLEQLHGLPGTGTLSSSATIVSVLDWEEAALADPRFEILLLCRKVCANRQQADYIWNKYHEAIAAEGMQQEEDDLIDPWLKLETVHNITSLVLQIVAAGGRNSWETNKDILAKIERDFQRLVWMGWTFL